jgi:four helix bundle protein
MTSEELKAQTKEFSIEIIKVCKLFDKSDVAKILARQLIRSATSVAANYRVACRARSKAEFIAKLHIAVEEADETMFWLEIIIEADVYHADRIDQLLKESKEILYILSSSLKTARENHKLKIAVSA